MRLFDGTIKSNLRFYLMQPALGFLIVTIFELLAWRFMEQKIIACFGATTFIIVTMPQARTSGERYLLGGYACAIVSGLVNVLLSRAFVFIEPAVFAGLAVSCAVFLMLCFNFEHPPAGALALGLVLSASPFVQALLSACGIALICLIMRFVRPLMKNLL